MKLKVKIIIGLVVLVMVFATIGVGVYTFFINVPSPASPRENNTSGDVIFVVKAGSSSATIISDLADAGLIRNATALKVHAKLNNVTLQAGTYRINERMSAKEILLMISEGRVDEQTVSMTFIEGRRLKSYVDVISKSTSHSANAVLEVLSDATYLNTLIEKYWFLTTDILNDNIYFALEGYLFPDTYVFNVNASVEEIIERMLNNTALKLEKYRKDLETSGFSVHELLSFASIIELEANKIIDRQSVSQVIHKRMNIKMSLGMDVTAYYAVQKEMGDELLFSDLNTVNAYNTREGANKDGYMSGKLPVGPICNPSISSIDAVFNPTATDYLYFYADIRTGDVHFAKNYEGFIQIIREVG